jgi:hypothetical protein
VKIWTDPKGAKRASDIRNLQLREGMGIVVVQFCNNYQKAEEIANKP